MSKDHKARRRHIKARVEHAEKMLCATRSSASGHSRAMRLQIEREIHARNKDLASLDLMPGNAAAGHSVPKSET